MYYATPNISSTFTVVVMFLFLHYKMYVYRLFILC